MENGQPEKLIDILRRRDICLTKGLSDDEVERVESTFGFRFPPDLRELLQCALPVSPEFPNWREDTEASLRGRLDWPADSICFDIEHNYFWMDGWGAKPTELSVALEVARREIAKAPTLIPIFSHRYIPDEPQLSGNPIFSVYQTDIIYYGMDLMHYFANEFWPGKTSWTWTEYHDRSVRKIRFWSELETANRNRM